MGQIMKSLSSFCLSVCLSVCPRSYTVAIFTQFWLNFAQRLEAQIVRKLSLAVKIRWTLPLFSFIFRCNSCRSNCNICCNNSCCCSHELLLKQSQQLLRQLLQQFCCKSRNSCFSSCISWCSSCNSCSNSFAAFITRRQHSLLIGALY